MFLWDFLRKSKRGSAKPVPPPAAPAVQKKADPKPAPAPDTARQDALAALLAQPADGERDQALIAFAQTAPAGLRLAAAEGVQSKGALQELTKLFADKDRRIYKLAKDRLGDLSKAGKKTEALAALTAQYQAACDAEVAEVTRLVEADHAMEALGKLHPLTADERTGLEALRAAITARLAAQTDAQREWVHLREHLTALKIRALDTAPEALLGELAELVAHGSALTPAPATKKIAKEIDALAAEIQQTARIRINHADKIAARMALIDAARALDVERVGQRDLDDLQSQWRALPGIEGGAVELAERFSGALKKAKDAMQAAHEANKEKAKTARDFFEHIKDTLAAALEEGHAVEAMKLHDQIKSRMDELRFCPAATSRRIHALLDEAGKLKGWQKFTNVNKRDELIERAEKIAATPLPANLQEDEIKALQTQWQALDKELGGATDKLWNRFRAATGKAYEPVRDFRKGMAKVRDHNAAAKKDQIRQLRDLMAQVDWASVDWKAVDQLRREAWAAWKQAGPTNRKVQESLGQEHGAVMKELDERLDGARAIETARRAKLTQDAGALLGKPDSLTAVRALQERWTSERIGVFLGRKQEDETWQVFRAACNAVFAQRDQKRNEVLGELEANFTSKQLLIEKAQALASLEDAKQLQTQLRQITAEWDATGRAPNNKAGAQLDAWRAAQDAAKARLRHVQGAAERSSLAAARAQNVEQRVNATAAQQDAKRTALLDLEIAAQVDSPDDMKDARLQRQVAMLAKSFQGERDAGSSLAARIAAWYAMPGGDEAMDARLAKVLAKAGLG